jgi:hypothetical protein
LRRVKTSRGWEIHPPKITKLTDTHEPSNSGADDPPGLAVDRVLVSMISVAMTMMTRPVEIFLLFMMLFPFGVEISYWLLYLKIDPRLDSIRSDTRFSNMLGRAGLAQ